MKKIFLYFLVLGLAFALNSKIWAASTCPEIFSKTNGINESNLNTRILRNNQKRPSEEADLIEKGHRPIYTQGLDRAVELIALGKKLRANKIDPYKTHIPEFADSIPKHINYIHQFLLSKKEVADLKQKKHFNSSLKILEEIEQEALQKIKDNQVTYAWNLKINVSLSLVADIDGINAGSFQSLKDLENIGEYSRYWATIFSGSHKHIKEQIAQFPEEIYLPIIKEMGIMGFNRSFLEGINFLNLRTENDEGGVLDFYLHDNVHANLKVTNVIDADTSSLFLELWEKRYPMMRRKMENLSVQKREMIEMIYFLIFHESSIIGDSHQYRLFKGAFDPYSLWSFDHKSLEYLSYGFYGEFASFLPKDIRGSSEKKIKNYLEESLKTFADLFDPLVMEGSKLFENMENKEKK